MHVVLLEGTLYAARRCDQAQAEFDLDPSSPGIDLDLSGRGQSVRFSRATGPSMSPEVAGWA